MTTADAAVLLYAGRSVPRPLRGLAVVAVDEPRQVDELTDYRRLIVVGGDADLAAVLTRLMRTERLDVEVGFVSRRPSAATRAYRLPSGWRAARRAVRASVQRVPLIRDDTGTAIVGAASWQADSRGANGLLHGEAVVDDTTLFDGEVHGVRVEPLDAVPGLRAAVLTRRGRPRRWVPGRAVQLGCTGVVVCRDGKAAPRAATRSTFYRHIEGWLLVR